jgi:hypothetical protein
MACLNEACRFLKGVKCVPRFEMSCCLRGESDVTCARVVVSARNMPS